MDTIRVKLVPIGTGISDLPMSEMVVYPNPATDKLFITTTFEECDFRVFDALSKQVLNGQLSGSEKIIETKNLPSGTYTVELNNGRQQAVQQILINK